MNNFFPNDENGDVLRRMLASGDDLSKSRDIDFTVVLPSEESARYFSDNFTSAGYDVKVENSGCVPELPWDVIVSRNMLPIHNDITSFENELQIFAEKLGGRNDGWGCFEQING